MDYKYLVTSKTAHHVDARSPNSNPEIMLGDPGVWKSKTGDYIINNRRPNGAETLLLEVSDKTTIPNKATFVTNQISTAVCATAAWLQLLKMKNTGSLVAGVAEVIKKRLIDISHQSENYTLPYSDFGEYGKDWISSRAVDACFYIEAENIRVELGLPPHSNLWTIGQKCVMFSELFERFTLRLFEAAIGAKTWPGSDGEARKYLDKFNLLDSIFGDRCFTCQGVAVLDARGYSGGINQRHIVDWARDNAPSCNMTLTVQDKSLNLIKANEGLKFLKFDDQFLLADPLNPHHIQLSAYAYKLGYVPLLPAPNYSDRGVWDALTERECSKRAVLDIEPPFMGWREHDNYSGHSSPIDGYLLTLPEITAIMKHHNNV